MTQSISKKNHKYSPKKLFKKIAAETFKETSKLFAEQTPIELLKEFLFPCQRNFQRKRRSNVRTSYQRN